jgi:UDP-glucose:glycoprotein glucosyltransferase
MIFNLKILHDSGHCYEKETREPPRGLQLLLGTKDQPHMVDTIVMANLGYWQLKAAPGVWTLALAPGRSTEIYTLSGKDEGTDKGPLSKRIIISDFRGLPVRIDVVKKKGMENEKILDIEGDEDDEKAKVLPCVATSFTYM